MTADELRTMYLEFFEKKDHAVISGGSLMPQNDPSVLFTTAGMHPLVPYLLGEKHPSGKRLCNCQKCIRTPDIDDVGDPSHLTFFEMLGNWSLGDYFKEEAIEWSYEFLTSGEYLGFDEDRLHVTVHEADDNGPRDDEAIRIWRGLGIPDDCIYPLTGEDNWWGLPGDSGPCGPDTEMFIDTGREPCGPDCRPGCSCGKYFEIWNDVFMTFEKQPGGKLAPLAQHNVDTGMGVERTVAMLMGEDSVYGTGMFKPTLEAIESLASRTMDEDASTTRAYRVIADHVRSAAFILGDDMGVTPGNLGAGYTLRSLVRRAVRHARNVGMSVGFSSTVAESVIDNYRGVYPELERNRKRVLDELVAEEEQFEKTLDRGMAELDKVLGKLTEHGGDTLSGRVAFRLYDTYGFPLVFTEEICRERHIGVDRDGYEKAFSKHKEVSRQGAAVSFKGGLADSSEATTRLHTATHLLHMSLRKVLGDHVEQRGSNITAERLRFDFSHPAKMTDDEKQKVEKMVNEIINKDVPVTSEVMTLDEAKKAGAMALFAGKYGEKVKVYSVGDFSKEVCGGPHVSRTGELGRFRLLKEGASSAGVRRIRAVLEYTEQ